MRHAGGTNKRKLAAAAVQIKQKKGNLNGVADVTATRHAHREKTSGTSCLAGR
jgi:hypothetical protein